MKPYAFGTHLEDAIDTRIGRSRGYYNSEDKKTHRVQKRSIRAEFKKEIKKILEHVENN